MFLLARWSRAPHAHQVLDDHNVISVWTGCMLCACDRHGAVDRDSRVLYISTSQACVSSRTRQTFQPCLDQRRARPPTRNLLLHPRRKTEEALHHHSGAPLPRLNPSYLCSRVRRPPPVTIVTMTTPLPLLCHSKQKIARKPLPIRTYQRPWPVNDLALAA